MYNLYAYFDDIVGLDNIKAVSKLDVAINYALDNKLNEKEQKIYNNEEVPIHLSGVVVHNSDFQSNAKEGIKDFFAETYGKDNICSVDA